MNELLTEIAKTFNIGNETVKNIIQNYPQLRQQIAVYNITTTIEAITGVAIFLTLVVSIFAGLYVLNMKYEMIENKDNETQEATKLTNKIAKVAFIGLVVSILTFIVMDVLQNLYATDVVFLKTMLSQMHQ